MNAQAPVLITATLRITRVRLRNTKKCVLFGHRVDLQSNRNDRSSTYVAAIPANVCDPQTPQVGEIWEVYGESSIRERNIPDLARPISDTQIDAQSARLLRPSASQLVQWLADNVKGVGTTIAQRLVDHLSDMLGDKMYEALDNKDNEAISPVIPNEALRDALFEKWLENGDAATLRFVQQRCIPLPIARKAIKFHRKETIDKLLDDPYRLLSFSGSWAVVDGLARNRFDVGLGDTRRLSAALEESLYSALKRGHTCQNFDDLYASISELLKPHSQPKKAFTEALLNGQKNGQFVLSGDTSNPDKAMLHATGTWLQEKFVAQFIRKLLEQQHRVSKINVAETIEEFENDEQAHLGIPDFHLNTAQRQAVETSFSNRFSIITGGAGVGKTTVLKALYRLLDKLDRPRYQMALSGRATARMMEATHEPATTIARFLKDYKYTGREPSPVIIIDEASMLDLHTFYLLARKLPLDTMLILVGDPYQLPPIGAGLVLHLLCEMPNMPVTELTVVKRQAADSAIPAVSRAVRDGAWPKLSANPESEVAFIPCSDSQILRKVMELYELDRDNTQVLGAVKADRFSGIRAINAECHSRYTGGAKQLFALSEETGEVETTGLSEGDLLLYTRNDWDRGIQNGSLGKLLEVYDQPIQASITVDQPDGSTKVTELIAVAKAELDFKVQYLTAGDIDYLEHAYAITVHKAQGSQFERVIVPIRPSQILDRTFIYTAITRAQRQVFLIGDEQAARAAVEAAPKAFLRKVGLGELLAS